MKQTSLVLPLGAVALALLAGCASLAGKPEDIVRTRAQERVDLILNNDFGKAYAYLLPSYRAQYNEQTWRGKFGSSAQWINPKVSSVKCPESDRCEVEIALKVRVLMGNAGLQSFDTVMRETWLQRDGQWWFYQAP